MYYIAKRTVKVFVDGLCTMLYNLYIFCYHADYTVIIIEYHED